MAAWRGGLAVLAVLALSAPAVRAEVVRTVRAEIPDAQGSRFGVENLAGTMRVVSGPGDSATVVATVHAETQALADAVKIERIESARGNSTWRVRYPYDRVRTFRYVEPGRHDDGEFFLGFWGGDRLEYDGRQVRVSPGRGTRLWVDLEIRVPSGPLRATFRNFVGLIEAEDLQGELGFEVASADMHLENLDGEISLNGSSGDVRARDVRGRWKSEFSSGDCRLDGFDGESLSFRVSSGDISTRGVKARKVEITSNSGDVRFVDADVEEFTAEASSGDIALENGGEGLKNVRVETSSGDVRLRLPDDMPFDAEADQSSGDMRVGFTGGTQRRVHDELVAYRHGAGGARIRVETSSGDFSLLPR